MARITSCALKQHGRKHFTKVFSIRSQFEEMLGLVRQREVRDSLGNIPTSREMEKALEQLKNGKAAGQSTILPEMLKAGMKNSIGE